MRKHEEDQNAVGQFLHDNKREDTLALKGCQFIAYYLNPLIYISFSGLYFCYFI